MPRLPRALRPFLVSQYRILAVALLLSLLGAGVWLVAVVFQVRDLGGGPLQLSQVATANAIGLIVAVLLGGVAADRIPQKFILLAVEVTKCVAVTFVAILALTGSLELWHLIVASALFGLTDGAFYPAYSALLPSVLPEDQLLAANGVEGMLRPTLLQALGPGIAALLVAAWAPAAGFVLVIFTQVCAIAVLVALRKTAVRRTWDPSMERRHPIAEIARDLAAGFVYMVQTPWFFGTLIFACLMVLIIMGPIEVLLPFASTEQTGGGPEAFALVLAAFGVGEALASLAVASVRLPRRYLTVMTLVWGFGCVPLAVIGITDQLWLMVVATFTCGIAFGVGQVIWGTLLQRRVPPEMLGRASSLDFFVSLALMPISMALAGPVGESIGFGWTFAAAGLLPALIAVAVVIAARMPRDEIAHPLRDAPALEGS